MPTPAQAYSLEEQIDQWRNYLRRRQAIQSVDVAELEDHLREQVAVLVNAGLAKASILPGGDGTAGTIAAAEVASLASGALVEEVRDVKRAPTSNAEIDALVTKVTAEVQDGLQASLADFGFTR